jgi:hypothetical protein
VAVSRRRFLGLLGGALGASVVGATGVVGLDGRLRHKLEDEWAYADGPDLSIPSPGAHMFSGSFQSRFMHREVGWSYSLPAKVKPRFYAVSRRGTAFLGAPGVRSGLVARRSRATPPR